MKVTMNNLTDTLSRIKVLYKHRLIALETSISGYSGLNLLDDQLSVLLEKAGIFSSEVATLRATTSIREDGLTFTGAETQIELLTIKMLAAPKGELMQKVVGDIEALKSLLYEASDSIVFEYTGPCEAEISEIIHMTSDTL